MAKVLSCWREKDYYEVAEIGSQEANHPAFVELLKWAKKSRKILDLGCGEGTRLALLSTEGKRFGIDISDVAIRLAQKKYTGMKFLQGDIERLPFDAESFDLVYSFFVLEHTDKTEEVLKEAVRVLKGDGILILAAPNFGSPNRRSPNSKEGKLGKLLNHKPIGKNTLGWTKVVPRKGKYFIDADTTIEPYLETLIVFLERLGVKILKASSLWELDDFSARQILFKLLGMARIPPFVWWGPQLFVVAKK